MPQKPDYDYIILGGGCAGLSLIMHMLSSPQLSNKRMLLIEKEQKNKNDRTWCFWEKGNGFFENIVHRKWQHAWFHGEGYSSLKALGPYAYKMIRGLDFYEYCYAAIQQAANVDILHSSVEEVLHEDGFVQVRTANGIVTGTYAFNSILTEKPEYKESDLVLLQHFKGWIIETPTDFFDTENATLMDFRVDQAEGTTFVYVMPLSSTKALVEYTLFTPSLLHEDQYEEGLKNYVADYLKLSDYTIIEKEFGIIPMTNHAFSLGEGNVVNMGTAGGQTKPSSGYTFRFIQKHVAAIVGLLEKGEHPLVKKSFMEKRFMWFDSVLLHILYHKKMTGSSVFTLLFSRNKIKRIFKFLDNETNLLEEFVLLNSLPQWPFMKAGWKEMNRS
jgi:lycopene beta-cyclase